MDEKHHFGNVAIEASAESPGEGVARRHFGGRKNNTDLAPMIGQMHACIPRSDLLEALPRHGVGSSLIRKLRRIFGATFIVLGVSVSVLPALAEINEDPSNTGTGVSAYIHDILPQKLAIHFLVDDYDGLTESNLADEYKFLENDFYGLDSGQKYSGATTSGHSKLGRGKDIGGFGELFAPETVWSLDVSTGAHLEHNRGEFGSGLDIAPVSYRAAIRPWSMEVFDPWVSENSGGGSDGLLVSPPQFQVASCSGAAERRDLDRCRPGDDYASQDVGGLTKQSSGNVAIASNNGLTSSSGASSTPDQQGQSDPLQNPSRLIPASVNDSGLQDVSTLANLCGDVSSCAAIETWYLGYWRQFAGEINPPTRTIDPPTAPSEPPIPPIDSSTPPDLPPPVISVGDPWPGSGPGPISTPPITSSTVPETSTWIMTIIGFSVMVAVGKRRAINSIKQAALGTVLKLAKQPFGRDTI